MRSRILAPLKAGHGFVSNGPLLGLLLDGRKPGDTLAMKSSGKQAYRVALRSPVAVDHLELVHNGQVVKRFELTGERRMLRCARARSTSSRAAGCCCAPGTTTPIRSCSTCIPTPPPIRSGSTCPGAPSAAAEARYFVAWLDRVIEAAGARDDYNDARANARPRSTTCDAARAIFQRKAEGN